MVLHPLVAAVPQLDETAADEKPVPVWSAVEKQQKRPADRYLLISQPNHADLSGALAGNFVSDQFPHVDPLIAQSIGAHDSGWSIFPQEADPAQQPFLSSEGRPLTFIEFGPREFLRAWTASIDRAEGMCPAGGIIVSRHFSALGSFRIRAGGGLSEGDRQLVCSFLQRENDRQRNLLASCSASARELDALLEVLQFCDLLSLYLCSGAERWAEFPQGFAGRPVRISRSATENVYRLAPSPFQANGRQRTISLEVPARCYPEQGQARLMILLR